MSPWVSSVSVRWSEAKSEAARSSGKRLDPVDAELGEALGAHVGIEGEDLHVQAAREPRHLAPDAAEADEAERLPGELVAGEPRAVPAAFLERGVGLRNRAREAEQETERVLRRRDDGGLRRVRDHDSAPRGRVEIDVVDPHPGPADHLELRRFLDQAGVEVRAAADDDRVVVADPRGEVAVRVHVDVEALAQEVDPRRGYGFANENSHVPRVSRAKEPASGAMDSAQHGQVPRAPDPAASGPLRQSPACRAVGGGEGRENHTETGSAYASSAAVTAAERSMSAPASAIASSRAASAVVTSKTSM